MSHRQRLGIRAQLTLIVLLAALLSTGATLWVANQAIAGYAVKQATDQAQLNTNIALLVLRTQYGRNISIAADGALVADAPTNGNTLGSADANGNYGKYRLDGDSDYVSAVKGLIGGYSSGYTGYIAVYKCGTPKGTLLTLNGSVACPIVTSTSPVAATGAANGAASSGTPSGSNVMTAGACSDSSKCLPLSVASNMALTSQSVKNWSGQVTINSNQYYANYSPLLNPQNQAIGVLLVGVPFDAVAATQRNTAVELVLVGVIIMIAGVIFALLFASAIIATLQRAARQVSGASENITTIATQQTGGSAQQVWAVNAINKALQTFTDTARDISERTDQLALMGNQVIQRRGEIAPAQIDQILGYMTRSVRDISLASRQQVAQYERMTGAMQAVIEIAEQVAASSKEATDSAARLDTVVGQLQELVGVQRLSRLRLSERPALSRPVGSQAQGGALPAVRVVRAPGASQGQMGQMPAPMGMMGQMAPPTGGNPGGVQINRNMAPVRAATGIGMYPGQSETALGGGYAPAPGAQQAPYGGAGGPESLLGLPPLPGGAPGDPYGMGQMGQIGQPPTGQAPMGQPAPNSRMRYPQGQGQGYGPASGTHLPYQDGSYQDGPYQDGPYQDGSNAPGGPGYPNERGGPSRNR